MHFISMLARGAPGHCALPNLRANRPNVVVKVDSSRKPKTWIVLQFESTWCKAGVAGHVKRIFLKWEDLLAEYVPEVSMLSAGISWSLTAPHLGTIVKKSNYSTPKGRKVGA